jgi:hypothetical protein
MNSAGGGGGGGGPDIIVIVDIRPGSIGGGGGGRRGDNGPVGYPNPVQIIVPPLSINYVLLKLQDIQKYQHLCTSQYTYTVHGRINFMLTLLTQVIKCSLDSQNAFSKPKLDALSNGAENMSN